jgi:hypothetical protein
VHHHSLLIAVLVSLTGGPCRCAFGSKAKAPTCMSARTVNYEYILNEVQGEHVGVVWCAALRTVVCGLVGFALCFETCNISFVPRRLTSPVHPLSRTCRQDCGRPGAGQVEPADHAVHRPRAGLRLLKHKLLAADLHPGKGGPAGFIAMICVCRGISSRVCCSRMALHAAL